MVESFMGNWGGALYDPLSCSLSLRVFRPTFELGPPAPAFPTSRSNIPLVPDERTCLITQAWVRVSLVA
jgi:hypothetical protein